MDEVWTDPQCGFTLSRTPVALTDRRRLVFGSEDGFLKNLGPTVVHVPTSAKVGFSSSFVRRLQNSSSEGFSRLFSGRS